MANLRDLAKMNPFHSPTQPKPERNLAAASGEFESDQDLGVAKKLTWLAGECSWAGCVRSHRSMHW